MVLGTESAMRKDLTHGVSLAAHQPSQPVAETSAPARHAEAEPAEPVPPPVNYSLKDVSRSAARGAERDLISRMLQQTRWNRKEAADMLGISYKALLYKIKENGLDKAQ